METEVKSIDTSRKYVPNKEFYMYCIGGAGQGMIYAIMSSYISDFYTNVMQLPLIFVLLLMLLARVWDAINDPMMGMIVDRTTTKWGKMKPYILWAVVPIAVLSFLMFYIPDGLSKNQLMVYAGIVYVLWGMTYTIADVPFWSLPNVMTPNPDERGKVISIGKTVNGVGSAIPMLIFAVLGFVVPKILPSASTVEQDKYKYLLIAIIASVLGGLLYANTYFHVKERVNIPNKPRRDKSEPSTLMRVFKCKPLMIVVIMGILSSGRYLVQAASVHVARYGLYVGPEITEGMDPALKAELIQKSISTVSTVLMVCSAIGMFGSMLVMPFLYKKFNYKKIIIFTCLVGFAASVCTTIIGLVVDTRYALYACIPFIILSCVPLGALNVTSSAMIGDCLDYMEWKTGHRDNALGAACQSFVNKLGNAVATTGIILMYMLINLDPASMYAKEAVISALDLAPNMRFAMFSLISIVPGVSMLLCAIPLFFYDLVGEKKDKITRELAEQREEAGITID